MARVPAQSISSHPSRVVWELRITSPGEVDTIESVGLQWWRLEALRTVVGKHGGLWLADTPLTRLEQICGRHRSEVSCSEACVGVPEACLAVLVSSKVMLRREVDLEVLAGQGMQAAGKRCG